MRLHAPSNASFVPAAKGLGFLGMWPCGGAVPGKFCLQGPEGFPGKGPFLDSFLVTISGRPWQEGRLKRTETGGVDWIERAFGPKMEEKWAGPVEFRLRFTPDGPGKQGIPAASQHVELSHA